MFQLKTLVPLLLTVSLAWIAACASAQAPSITPTAPAPTDARAAAALPPLPRQHSGEQIAGLGDPVDAPNFVDSYPNHAQTLIQSPAQVFINFDTALLPESMLAVEHDGKRVTTGNVEFDARKTYLSASLPPNLGDGLYRVNYRACFVARPCADGSIGFQVAAARAATFVDLTRQSKVTIHLKNIQYTPSQFIISPGTHVTWVNDDPFEHFVNSDPHPSHNAFPRLNSLDIPPGSKFEFTFQEPGVYTFHCSAHVPQNMYGEVIVRADQAQAAPTEVAVITPTPAPSPTLATPTRIPTRTPAPVATKPPPTLTAGASLSPTPAPSPSPTPLVARVPEADLPAQKFAAHFVASQPAHADLLAAPPARIQIDFNFTLARNSNLNVVKDGEKLTLGDLELTENRLSMSASLPNAGAGAYHVFYRACWPDKTCHDGEFAFVVR